LESDAVTAVSIDQVSIHKTIKQHASHLQPWVDSHHPPHHWALVFFKGDTPIGFTRFSPDFPGCSPFVIFAGAPVLDIRVLIAALAPFALPGKNTLKITTGDALAIALFKASHTALNYSLYEMGITLTPVTPK
jgi:hypothetical protein